MQNTQNRRFTTRQLAFIGVMAAIVFVSNYIQIKIPVGVNDVTRIHVANAFCLLAGIAMGPVHGGLAAGIGSALYDVLDPVYITSAPFTFAFKFLMAYVAGKVAGKNHLDIKMPRALTAACLALCFITQLSLSFFHAKARKLSYVFSRAPAVR